MPMSGWTLGLNLWDSGMRDRVETLQWSQAQRLLRLGVTVVIEWGSWGRAEREHLRAGAREIGAAVELCYLLSIPHRTRPYVHDHRARHCARPLDAVSPRRPAASGR